MSFWLQCHYSIPHRPALLNGSWQLQKQVIQDHPELDCANIQLRINLASMTPSLLNSSHCFYSACPISCLTSPGLILTPVGWAGERQQSENFGVLNAICILHIGTHVTLFTKTIALKRPSRFPIFPASLLSTYISRAIKSVFKICFFLHLTEQRHTENLCLKGHRTSEDYNSADGFFNISSFGQELKVIGT